jgi:hypothetical protein
MPAEGAALLTWKEDDDLARGFRHWRNSTAGPTDGDFCRFARGAFDPLYVERRRVLLDALLALAPYGPAIIVAGAKAIVGSQAWDAADGPDTIDLGGVERPSPWPRPSSTTAFSGSVPVVPPSGPISGLWPSSVPGTSGRARWPPS